MCDDHIYLCKQFDEYLQKGGVVEEQKESRECLLGRRGGFGGQKS
jgi:hypothetical protein